MRKSEARDTVARGEQVCPDMPRQGLKMSGRLQANEYAMPRLPRHAPTQISMRRAENILRAWGRWRAENQARQKEADGDQRSEGFFNA
jgi:hypothetical protein